MTSLNGTEPPPPTLVSSVEFNQQSEEHDGRVISVKCYANDIYSYKWKCYTDVRTAYKPRVWETEATGFPPDVFVL